MIFEAFLTALIVVFVMWLWKKTKRPVVFVIEDSESDMMLLKINTSFEKFDVRYYRSLESIGFRFGLTPPDAVIVDYKLKGKTGGDQLFKFCKRNHIPVLMVTGYDGEIMGVDPKYIVRKTGDKTYYQQITSFLEEVAA